MKIAVFPKTCARAGIPVMDAFIKSIKDDEVMVCENHERPDADAVVIWSVLLNLYGRKPIYDHYTKKGTKIIVIEVGGIIRNQSWRIGINGINREAEFGNKNCDNSRLKKLQLDPKPWKKERGNNIIICTQNENSAAWPKIKMLDWCEQVLQWIRSQSPNHIILRPHPRHRLNFDHLMRKYGEMSVSFPQNTGNKDEVDFKQIIQNAHCVINYNSNPAIESVLEGVPVYVDESSLCWPVGNSIGGDINNPVMPDRTTWLNEISYCEWFIDEIRKGIPWQRLRPNLTNG